VSVQIEVVEDPARACAAMMLGVAAGRGHIVLSGGSTPRNAYAAFVHAVGAVGVDVSGATMWFGDERCVPPDDERSNYFMVRESLLDPLDWDPTHPAPAVFRMKGELGPFEAADEYERELSGSGPDEFDLLLLGIGPDGHCASLFPDQPTLNERSRMVVGVEQAGLEPFVPRVSFTLSAIARGKQVVFLAAGEGKARAVAAAFGPGAVPDPHVPSSLVAPLAREVTVLLDPPAAAGLGEAAGASREGGAGVSREGGAGVSREGGAEPS
jgi:6-phosphogluconolactonase